ncbi:MAG: IS6 family transposase [Nitrososphaera sp.]
MEMLQNGATIKENGDGSFSVPSQTSTKIYEVRVLGQRMVCTCPDFEYRQVEACKHIHLVKFTLSVKYLKDEPKAKVFAEDAIPCDKCGSIRVIRFGYDCGKQTFYCKDCKHKFRQPSLLKKAKFSSELVTLTLDLYFSGLSLRKIARTLSSHFNIDLNYSTIYTWIKRYIPMISEYVNELAPQLSKTWHADELFVRVRGGTHKGQAIGFVWNIMDRETRFLIVSKLTTTRSAIDTTAAFEDAEHNAHGIKPEVVFTDSLRHYGSGMKVFPDAKRVDNCGISKRENNNRIERLNGTLRERTKVQRGWKSAKTPLAEGQRIQYNFVKPHMALDGKTPAAIAGIGIADKNKWLAMLKAAAPLPPPSEKRN